MTASTLQRATLPPEATARRVRRRWLDWMVIPASIVLIVVIGYPIVRAVWLSFTNTNLITGDAAAQSVGAANYGKLWRDPVFWQSLRNTFVFAAVSLVGTLGVGLALAIATENLRGPWRFVRGFLLAPWAIPVIVVAFLFQFLFLDRGGLVNDLLIRTHLRTEPIHWLTSTDWSLWSVIIANVWQGAPFFLLVFTAALRAVPDEVIEAAKVDRTGPWTMVWRIKLPFLVAPGIVAAVIATIGNLNQFPLVYSLNGGGPGYSSTTLTVYLYRLVFVSYDLGYASAIGVVWLFVLMVIAGLFLRRLRGEAR